MIAWVLKFNYEAFFRDLLNEVSAYADKTIDEMYAQSTRNMREKAIQSVKKIPATISANIVKAQIYYGARAIMESYGTGSLMDKSNPYLKYYMGSDKWNPARTSHTIVGRRAGEYINIYGKKQVSKGNYAGQNIEKWVKGRRFKVRPIKPTNGIAYMERDYIRKNWTKVDDGLKQLIIKFMKTKAHKYFYNTK